MSLYNTVEYPGFPFPQTHPDRLATIAALHGLPHATFTGIDLAQSPSCSAAKCRDISRPLAAVRGTKLTRQWAAARERHHFG